MENNSLKPDIITIIEREGLPVKRKGTSLWLSCPFHEDKNPSLKINHNKQTFYCFSCNSHGDAVSFIMRLHGLSFKDALKYLNIKGNAPTKTNPKEKTKRQLLSAFRSWEKKYLRQLTDYYREIHNLLRGCRTMEEVERFSKDLHRLPIVEYRMEILFNGTDEEKHELYLGENENE